MIMIKRIFLLIALLTLSACQWSKLAERDPQVELLLIQVNVKIEAHWKKILLVPAHERKFARYQESYHLIANDLNVLLQLNKSRVDNQESIIQMENVLTMWQQDLNKHKHDNTVTDFIAKRREQQYQRTIYAILKGEQVKPLAS